MSAQRGNQEQKETNTEPGGDTAEEDGGEPGGEEVRSSSSASGESRWAGAPDSVRINTQE